MAFTASKARSSHTIWTSETLLRLKLRRAQFGAQKVIESYFAPADGPELDHQELQANFLVVEGSEPGVTGHVLDSRLHNAIKAAPGVRDGSKADRLKAIHCGH